MYCRLFLGISCVGACSGNSDPTQTDPVTTDTVTTTLTTETVTTGPKVSTQDNGDGTFLTEVNATNGALLATFSFETGMDGEPYESATGWDLAFNRDSVVINGGTSGAGGMQGAKLDFIPFADVAFPVAGGWGTDGDDFDGDLVPDYLFTGWYAYDLDEHTLTPVDRTYVVLGTDGIHYSVRMTAYYNAEGVSGWPSFTWAPLALPSPLSEVSVDGGTSVWTVDASSEANWVHLSLAGRTALEPVEGSTSWDFAIQQTRAKLDGGVSGAGLAEVAVLAQPFATVDAVPDPGAFATDTDVEVDGITEYAMVWHDGSAPIAQTFVLHTADDTYAKVAFTEESSGVVTLQWAWLTP